MRTDHDGVPWAWMRDDGTSFWAPDPGELDLQGLTFIPTGDAAVTRRAARHAVWDVRRSTRVPGRFEPVHPRVGYLVPAATAALIIHEVQRRRWREQRAPDPEAAAEAGIAAGVLLPPRHTEDEVAAELALTLRAVDRVDLALIVEREQQVRRWRSRFRVGRRTALRVVAAGVRIEPAEPFDEVLAKLRAADLADLAADLEARAALAALAG